jgi:hypothetical protein
MYPLQFIIFFTLSAFFITFHVAICILDIPSTPTPPTSGVIGDTDVPAITSDATNLLVDVQTQGHATADDTRDLASGIYLGVRSFFLMFL